MSDCTTASSPYLSSLGEGEAMALHHLEQATVAFRENASRGPEELDAWNAQCDALRRQFIFRNLQPILQKQVFLCMPRSGPVEFEAVSAMYMAAGPGSPHGVIATDKFTSCTPGSFNQGWCDAWNARDGQDKQLFSWFCLLHSDVYPINGIPKDNRPWLQVLLDEAEAGGYDVLHAFVAIKDQRGLTSTAIGLKDFRHQYAKSRRITTTEIHKCPETFELRDYLDAVGYEGWGPVLRSAGLDLALAEDKAWLADNLCMCNNTGVMLVRMSPRMKRFPGFRFQNKVCLLVDGKEYDLDQLPPHCLDEHGDVCKGALVPKFTPEDWDFGRWCTNNGLKVGGTRKVLVSHIGRGVYTTQQGWGTEERDEWFFSE